MYSCYQLTDVGKRVVSKMFANLHIQYQNIKCDHCTHAFPDNDLPPHSNTIEIIGVYKTADIIGLLVTVDGQATRPDGKRYHITVAHTDNVKPVYSNVVLEQTPEKVVYLSKPMILSETIHFTRGLNH